MRRAVLILLIFLLFALGLVLQATRDPGGGATDLDGRADKEATEDEGITLRGRAPAASEAEENVRDTRLPTTDADEESDDKAPVPLTIHLELEGHPAGTPLVPPAQVWIQAVTDPIDSFSSLGVSVDVTTSGRVDVDVRSVLGELGRLGRAPEMRIGVHPSGAHMHGRTLLVADVEELLAGRRQLDALSFTLRPTTRISGRVFTHEGQGMSMASVRAYPMPGGTPLSETAHAVSVEDDGRFEMRLESEGRFLLVALAAGWEERKQAEGHRWLPQGRMIVFQAGEELEPIEFHLDEGRSVEGIVVHPADGQPGGKGMVLWELEEQGVRLQGGSDSLAWIGGDVVWASGEAGISDGRFLLRGLPPFPCVVAVERLEDLCLASPVGQTVLEPTAETLRLEPHCATLEVVLEADEGVAVPSTVSVQVHASDDDDAKSWSRRVSAGSRVLVSPDSAYRLEVQDSRFASSAIEVVAPGNGETRPVLVPLVPLSRSDLVVHLRMPDGTPYTGWVAFMAADRGSPRERPRRVWGTGVYVRDGVSTLIGVPDGRWRLHMRPGRTTVWGRPSGYLERTREVMVPPASDPEATLVVEAGARLVVRVADGEGVPRGGRVAIRRAGSESIPAVFLSEHEFFRTEKSDGPGVLPVGPTCWLATALEPGTYEVEITPDGGSASVHTIHAESGKTAAISITVR